MKINIDRLCTLAGISRKTSKTNKRSLNEASNRSWHEDNAISDEAEFRYGKNQLNEGEFDEDLYEGEFSDEELEEEMIEVDEAMLVQELRRARKIMAESKRRKTNKKSLNEEARLKKIIEEEVANVMEEFNLSNGWVYGKRKPRRSKRGHVATAFPGIGFK